MRIEQENDVEYSRATFQVLHALRDRSDRSIARECGLAQSTISKLRLGGRWGTRRPQHRTLVKLAHVCGMVFRLGEPWTGRERRELSKIEREIEAEAERAHKAIEERRRLRIARLMAKQGKR